MKFQTSNGALMEEASAILAIGLYDNFSSDAAFKAIAKEIADLEDLLAEEKFKGKTGQTARIRLDSGQQFLAVGLGDKGKFDAPDTRDYAARVLSAARARDAGTISIVVPNVRSSKSVLAAQFVVEGMVLGAYKFNKYKSKTDDGELPSTVRILPDARGKKSKANIAPAIRRGQHTADAVNMARDLINEPAEAASPSRLAKEAKNLAKKPGLKAKIISAAECKKMGMNLFLAVGRGSSESPQFIHLTYTPKRKAQKKIALVGKGVTFDSGGYSLKPSAGMLDMKMDMSGAAAVISAMGAIAELGSKYEVHAVVAACENMVSGGAYKLGDVFKGMSGTTVEINNTDAEGRLTLADALTYARTKIKADEIFDFATLTGACVVALGPNTAGVMSDSEEQVKAWLKCAEVTGESMWRLPLEKALVKQLKSEIADTKNTGERYGGAITAGLFLQKFVGDTPWVHTDIAGPAYQKSASPSRPRGGAGFAVSTIIDYCC